MSIRDELRKKANDLPLKPGVYIMKNAEGRVIYVGKSKALKNRVSQYFGQGSGHSSKTAKMVSNVRSFDYMLTDSEIEALALENKLIKLYTPRYNIRLKDGKSYPYIKVEAEAGSFPYVSVTRSRLKDRARYFGPYSGTGTAYEILETLKRVFGIPTCKYRFPRDQKKVRPCIYSQIGQCVSPCTENFEEREIAELTENICTFLRGNMGKTRQYLKEQMEFSAEHLLFERAALMRDRLKALERLFDEQKVVGKPGENFDVVGLYEDERSACICVMYVRDGAILDSEYIPFSSETIIDGEAIAVALCELYLQREEQTSSVYLDFPVAEEELSGVISFFEQRDKKVRFHIPEKGEKKHLCRLASANAENHAEKVQKEERKNERGLVRLAGLLGMEAVPELIESVDISGYGNEQIVAGYVTFENGKPKKSSYRLFRMKEVRGQDDYASMCEAVKRRLRHREEWPLPDLLLLDGGKGQVHVIKQLLQEEQVSLPVFGMVKDDYHKTRALTDGENEIGIAGEQSVYMLVYKIQEEVHRYASGAALKGKRSTLKKSSLEKIKGIGQSKARALLQMEGGLSAVKKATVEQLKAVKGISEKDAVAVYTHFHGEEKN